MHGGMGSWSTNTAPHCFHTNRREVWEFLNRFTKFRETQLRVMANTRSGLIPVPFNDVSVDKQ